MRLRDLLEYDDIVIQGHDNPDADAIACGYAVYLYLKAHGKKPMLIYGGRSVIRKSNLVMMVEDLHIPIRHVETLEPPELLVMVDCQYNGGNSVCFPAKNIAVIDHHRVSTQLPELSEVKTNLGACSTLVWNMLKDEGFDVENNKELATALYYGLYTDTGKFTEIVHPLDKDLRDEANIDVSLMRKYCHANMSLEELEVAGAALLHSDYLEKYRAAIVKSAPCDPIILGIISDLVLEVDAVDLCITFNVQSNGVKVSVRSCIKEVKASELAAEICKGIGTGGGHVTKAGGFIQMDQLTKEYYDFCRQNHFTPMIETDEEGRKHQPTASGIKSILEQRLRNYMDNTDIVYVGEGGLQFKNANDYYQKSIPWGYIRMTELVSEGTPVTVRTMQGDVDTVAQSDVILTIGPKGEINFRKETEFQKQYRMYSGWRFYLTSTEYAPTIKIPQNGEVISPMDYAKVCVPKGNKRIRAKQLDRKMKLFRKEDDEELYTLGRAGDYLVDNMDSINNIHIIKQELFEKIYRRADEKEQPKAVIFDLDGTLLYTLEDLKNAVNAALIKHEIAACTLEQVRQYVGNGIRKLMIRAVPGGETHPEFEQIFSDFKNYYDVHCLDNTRPYDGIMDMLKELKYRGVKTAIVSNKIDSAVKELDEHFFRGYIVTAIGEMEGVSRKPAPDMVQKAMQELKVEQEEVVYVGDSEVDIQTASNAGLNCISVKWGFRDEDFLMEHGAQTIIQTPLELLYLI